MSSVCIVDTASPMGIFIRRNEKGSRFLPPRYVSASTPIASLKKSICDRTWLEFSD